MSEYQYYEFQAIDRPLSRQEMAEVRSLSTRATITPTRFVNVYHWGDFKGCPLELMERYYDAFLYVANWGTHILMLRLPRNVLDPRVASYYCVDGEAFSLELTEDHVILSFDSEVEEMEEDLEEGEGWLSSLVPLRGDISGGDLRCLYLGWLRIVQDGVLREDVVEPEVPPGLNELTAPLESLVEFLRIDDCLLETAAQNSPPASEISPSLDEARAWLHTLSSPDKDRLLLEMACGDPQSARAEVRQGIRALRAGQGENSKGGQGRTVGELMAEADHRLLEKERRKEEERARRLQEEAAARAAYLDSLAGQESDLWGHVETLVETRVQGRYDDALKLLLDLRNVAERQQKYGDFQDRLKRLRDRHSRKSSFLERLMKAGL